MSLSHAEGHQRLLAIHRNLETVIRGKGEALEILVAALAAGGSVLMEDVPGVGKTTLAKTLAKSIDAVYNRVQFTPDLLPADILGASIYNPSNGEFTFHEGPVFCNVLLADEINRASPRTQSALLEAMSEQQATVEGVTHTLPAPFLVLATQNPLEFHGTYPLPEAQLDRFMIRLNLGYPSTDATCELLVARAKHDPLASVAAVISGDDVRGIQALVCDVRVDPAIVSYMVAIAEATREDGRLKLGVSPRGLLMLYRAAQAIALFAGRDYVLPDDIKRMAAHVLPHRLMLTSKAKYSSVSKESIVGEVMKGIEVPA